VVAWAASACELNAMAGTLIRRNEWNTKSARPRGFRSSACRSTAAAQIYLDKRGFGQKPRRVLDRLEHG